MTEKLLQTIWSFQYFNRSGLETTDGEGLEIIFQGTPNVNQGPDFLGARLKIGKTILAGSVELHLKSSDWNKHRHSNDENYNNVILHVVLEDDKIVDQSFPTLELKSRISRFMLEQYSLLEKQAVFIPCATQITTINALTLRGWQERLVAERLTRKANGILAIFEKTGHHWEKTFWQILCKTFGTKVNGDAFENLARNITYKTLARHRNNLLQLEALLLGGAQLLPESPADDYSRLLAREYHFLQTKYNLQPIHYPVHFLRMRPQNFPTIRLAQLAALVHKTEHLFSKVLEADSVKQVTQWLNVAASTYWNDHFRPGELSPAGIKKLGTQMTGNIIINAIVPVLFAYGLYHGKEHLKDKAIDWLQHLQPENNTITKGFENISVANASAFESQALIELKNEYCLHRRCLQCAIGNALLKQWNREG